MSRYNDLLKLIALFKPQSIIEVGVWNGENALRMIKAASGFNQNLSYRGYDLFEDSTPDIDALEFNVKPHNSHCDILAKLNTSGANVCLIKGNTRETLVPTIADFAFIDGGHSIETIRHDYDMLKRCGVVVLDDYYTPDSDGLMPDITKFGCNRIVENLPHAIIESDDWVKGGGRTNLAVVFGQ